MKRIVVTHFSGPLGYSLSRHYSEKDVVIDGVDQFLPRGFRRAPLGSRSCQAWLDRQSPGFMHYELDMSCHDAVKELIREIRPSAIIHSLPPILDDLPAPPDDLVLAGTRNLLEAAREFCWLSPFIFLSSSKVYADVLHAALEDDYANGIPEEYPLNPSPDPTRGAIIAADLLVQEFGRTSNLPTCCLRSPVPTDPLNPDGALVDPLARLVQASTECEVYSASAAELKQVREAIHARDIASFIELFCAQPRVGEVYNLGGGRENSYSIEQWLPIIEGKTGRPLQITLQDNLESAETFGFFSDLRKVRNHYPEWRPRYSLGQIMHELIEAGSLAQK